MHTCSLSVMRMRPLRPSVIAAASVIPPVSPMKVRAICASLFLEYFGTRAPAFVDANPVSCCAARWRSQRGHGPGGFSVQAEGVHRQHSR